MGFEAVLVGTLGFLATLSASAFGQIQIDPISFDFPPPVNLPSPKNFPSSNQPGSFSPFNPLPNIPQNIPSISSSPFKQPGEPDPFFDDFFSPPGSNVNGFNSNNFQQSFPQNVPSNEPGNFGSSSNIPQSVPPLIPPLTPSGTSNSYNPQQNIPQHMPPRRGPGGSRSHTPQSSPSQHFPSSNHPSSFNSKAPPQHSPPSELSDISSSGPPLNDPQLSPPSPLSGFGSKGPPLNAPELSPPSLPSVFNSNGPPLNAPELSPPSPPSVVSSNGPPLNVPQLSPPSSSQPSFNLNNPQSQQPPSSDVQTNEPPSNLNSPQNQNSDSINPSTNQNSTPGSPAEVDANPDSSKGSDSSESGTSSPSQHASSKMHHPSHPKIIAPRKSHSSASHPRNDENPLFDYRIVCLFNNRHYFRGGFTPSEIDPTLCTHVNYEFAILDPKSYEMMVGEPDLDLTQNFYQQALDLRKVNSKLKVLLSLGGWGDSTKKYSEMAADEEKRKNFVEKAVAFLKSHGFDGMDLAWEYPNCWQGAIGIKPEDKDNFVLLLKELKAAFEKEDFILSVSVGAIKREVEAAYDIPGISSTVDYINVMTYDMHGPWEKVTGHHVQFDLMPDDTDPYANSKAALAFWAEKGADKKKINMGLALYAKTFTLEDESNHGMGAPTVGVGDPGPLSGEGGFLLYGELCPLLNGGNWTEAEDKNAGFYAYSGDQWACYDNPLMIVRKAKFVVEEGYGGVLFKDLSGDDYKGKCFSMPFPLVKMCRLEMIQRIRKKMRSHG